MAADLAHQPPEERAGLAPARAASRAQHGGYRPSLAVEHHDGLEAVLVVVGVDEPKPLLAMDRVEGVVHVQDDATGHLPETAAVQPHHGAGHAQQDTNVRQVLEPRDGRLRAECGAVGQPIQRELEDRIVPQTVRVVAVLVPGRDHQHAKAQDGGEAVLDPLRRARVVDASGEPVREAEPALDLAQGEQAAVGGELPAVEAGDETLTPDR